MEHQFFYESHVSNVRITKSYAGSFPAHMHDKVELLYSLGAQTIVKIDDVSHTLMPGEVALIWPNHIHSYINIEPGLQYMAIIDTSYIHEHSGIFISHDCPQPFLSPDKVHPHILECLDTLTGENTPPMPLVSAYLDIMFGRILEKLELVPASEIHRQDLVGNILLYIAEHIHDEITLDILAKELYANKYQISRIFSTKIGCNLCTYINRLRVAVSLNLLKDPSLNISDIAMRCGFNSERTFFRVFREQCGLTPKQYRQRMDFNMNGKFSSDPMPRMVDPSRSTQRSELPSLYL